MLASQPTEANAMPSPWKPHPRRYYPVAAAASMNVSHFAAVFRDPALAALDDKSRWWLAMQLRRERARALTLANIWTMPLDPILVRAIAHGLSVLDADAEIRRRDVAAEIARAKRLEHAYAQCLTSARPARLGAPPVDDHDTMTNTLSATMAIEAIGLEHFRSELQELDAEWRPLAEQEALVAPYRQERVRILSLLALSSQPIEPLIFSGIAFGWPPEQTAYAMAQQAREDQERAATVRQRLQEPAA